ncbi:FUSC family protein [Paenirhodobacter enshiensis]|uniref:FUSC family protein n=1 Tax=Paenirhodobacter enshiensis TaxID=1105367 RepID=UPI0035AEF8EC
MPDTPSLAAVIRDLCTLRPQEPGAWKGTLRTGIISSVTVLAASALFGPTIGAMALFGAMLAQWEVGRGLVARVKTALIVGATMTGSMALGVSVAHERLWVIPVLMAVIWLTSAGYYSFVLTRGPGPLHLFYAAAIGSYFGMFGDIGWHGVEMTAFTTALSGAGPLTPELRLLRHRAYFAINRAWLLLQDTTPAALGLKVPRRFVDPMLAANRSVALATVHRRHPDARPVDPDPAADPMPGRPGLCYLIRHGTRLHSIPSFTAWRIALAAGLAGALTEGLGLGHPYWAILTAAIVLHLWIGRIATTLRAIHRAVGTVLGLCVVYAVGMTDPTPWVLVWAVVVSIVAMTMLLPFGYALAMIFVTPMSLLSIDAATGGPVMDLVRDRFVETLIGAAAAVLVTWLTGVREPARLVRAQLPRSLAAIRRTLALIGSGAAMTAPGRQARAELLFELLQNNAVLSRSSQEDPALSVWNEAETEISDTGYLVLGAFWTQNGAALMDVPAALRDIDALLTDLAGRAVDPPGIAARIAAIREHL